MIKNLQKLEKKFAKTQGNERSVFNGVFYPKAFPNYRVMTDGRMMLISSLQPIGGNYKLKGTDTINHFKADIVGATDPIEGTFPDFLYVMPKKIVEQYEIEIPLWIGDLSGKNCASMFLDLDLGVFSSTPHHLSKKFVRIDLSRLSWLAGEKVSVGFETVEADSIGNKPLAIWGAGISYNPTVNDWTFIVMPLKPKEKELTKPICELVEITTNVPETI